MKRYAILNWICFFAAVVTFQVGIVSTTVNAQCVRSTLNVPMWEIYGINPYQPRVRAAGQFTPLQSLAVNTSPVCCAVAPMIESSSVVASGEVFVGNISADEYTVTANTFDFDPANPNPYVETELPIAIEGAIVEGELTPTKEKSISSPSDIIVAPQGNEKDEPTPAPVLPNEMKAELERVRSEVTELKSEVTELREKARTSAERAYAAEKAAKAASAKAERAAKAASAKAERAAKAASAKAEKAKARKLKKKKAE